MSGTTAVTSTTVTAVANIATIGKAYELASVAGGVVADTMVAHPRRVGYIATTLGYSPAPHPPGIDEIIEAPAMPVTLTTNRDAVVLFPRSEVVLLVGPLSIQVAPARGVPSARLPPDLPQEAPGLILKPALRHQPPR